jgi:hypothetical protein
VVQRVAPRASSVTVITPINITVEGGLRGPEADKEMAAVIAKQARDVVRAEIDNQIRQQQRPGNLLNPANGKM